MKENKENVVEVLVYRDTIAPHEYDSNLSLITVTKNFMKKYFNEKVKDDYKNNEEYKNLTSKEWYNEVYSADDTEDFYHYAKEHDAIINVKHLNMENEIKSEIHCLEDVDDCFGYDFGNGKGVFVQVVNYGDGEEYLIERNYTNHEDVFEPYGDCNESCKFGDIDKCLEIILNIYEEE